jgi:hypothetical protein
VTEDTRRLRDETEVEGWSHSGWSYWMMITGLTTIRRMLNEPSCIRHKTKVLPRKIPKRQNNHSQCFIERVMRTPQLQALQYSSANPILVAARSP